MSEDDNVLRPENIGEKHFTQIISMLVGALLTIVGLSGMLFSGFAGLHMGPLHSTIIAAAGMILFYNGIKNNGRHAFLACLIFTIFFGIQAIAGFIFGQPGVPSIGHPSPDPLLLKIIPGFHEQGKHDHILNAIIAVVLLGGTLDWWRRNAKDKHKTHHTRRTHSVRQRRYDRFVHE